MAAILEPDFSSVSIQFKAAAALLFLGSLYPLQKKPSGLFQFNINPFVKKVRDIC
jgi:hypothetical protein